MLDLKERIAQRAAQELRPGDVVNLGIGLPMKVARFLPEGVDVTFESENGFLGIATGAEVTEPQPDLLDAGGHYSAIRPGACFFDSAESFGLIRGGHIDITVLGAMQVDQHGNLANWAVPGKLVVGMGGAMDLVVGARRVIIAMQHTSKGTPKIMKDCTLPLTAVHVVDTIITEMGVIQVMPEGLELTERFSDYTVEQIQAATEAPLKISETLKVLDV